MTVILRLARRYTSRRLLQSVLFVLGVALGVAMVIAIDIANSSASRAFELSAATVTGQATHQLTAGSGGLPTDIYTQLRTELGLREVAPAVEDYARALDLGGQPLRVLGIDVFAEGPFRGFFNSVEADEEGADSFDALNAFIAQPNAVLISDSLAERFDKQVGDTITLQPAATPVDLTIVGLLRAGNDTSAAALEDLVLMDIATAQSLFERGTDIDRIDLILPEGYDTAPIEAILPSNVVLSEVNSEDNTLAQMTAAFELNLQALSLLALVVGAFLIYNTVTFNVVQRRPVLGTMRALGTTQRQIFGLVLSEALLLAAIGTTIGLGLGVIFGRGAVGLVSQTVSDLYFTVNVNRVTVSPFTLLKGAAAGLLISFVAAAIPSWDATRTPPAGVLRRSSIEDQARQQLPLITGVGVGAIIVGLLILQIPSNSVFLSFAALFCIVLGAALLTPLILDGVMHALTPLTDRVFGVLGRMAPRAVSRSLSRTSVAVAALTVAVSVIVGVSVMISSFRTTVADWLETTLSADVYVSAPLLTSNRATVGVDPVVRDLILQTEGVERVSAARQVTATAPNFPDLPPVNINAVDFDLAGNDRRFVWSTAEDVQAALDAGFVMASEPFAFRRGITRQNNTITLLTDEGEQTFEVFGVFFDYTTDQGTLLMGMDTYHEFYDDRRISSVAAYVPNPEDIPAVIDQLETETLSGFNLVVQSNRSLREGVFEVFDQAFSITVALRLLATVVAFIGILSALLSLQLENTRQYGLMRAIGLTPGQLRSFTLIQTGLMGFVASLLAIPIGLALAAVLIYVINIRSFGWSMQFILLPAEMSQAFLVAIAAALLAGVYPAWKLSKLVTARALRAE